MQLDVGICPRLIDVHLAPVDPGRREVLPLAGHVARHAAGALLEVDDHAVSHRRISSPRQPHLREAHPGTDIRSTGDGIELLLPIGKQVVEIRPFPGHGITQASFETVMARESQGFRMDQLRELERPLGLASPEGLDAHLIAVLQTLLARRLSVDEDAMVIRIEALDRLSHPRVADLVARAHPGLRCRPDHGPEVEVDGMFLVAAAAPLGDRLPVIPIRSGIPAREAFEADSGQVLLEFLSVDVELVEVQGMARLAPGKVVEIVGFSFGEQVWDERMLVEIVHPVLLAEVAASDPVDEVGGHVFLVQIERVIAAEVQRPVELVVESTFAVEETRSLRDLYVHVVGLAGVPDGLDNRLAHLQGTRAKDRLVGRMDHVVAVFQERVSLEDGALRQQDVGELGGLVVDEGDRRHERDLLERLDSVDGRAVRVDGIAAVDHEHVEIVIDSVLLRVEHGLPRQIRARVAVRVVLPKVDGRRLLPGDRLGLLLRRHHAVRSWAQHRALLRTEEAAGHVGRPDQAGHDLHREVLICAVGGGVAASF